jgi:hypothetical protein
MLATSNYFPLNSVRLLRHEVRIGKKKCTGLRVSRRNMIAKAANNSSRQHSSTAAQHKAKCKDGRVPSRRRRQEGRSTSSKRSVLMTCCDSRWRGPRFGIPAPDCWQRLAHAGGGRKVRGPDISRRSFCGAYPKRHLRNSNKKARFLNVPSLAAMSSLLSTPLSSRRVAFFLVAPSTL